MPARRSGRLGRERFEGRAECVEVVKALIGCRPHRRVHRRRKFVRNRGLQLVQVRNLALQIVGRDGMGRVSAHGPVTGQHFEEHHAEREHVGPAVDLVRAECLRWRHVFGRTHDDSGTRQPALELTRSLQLRDTKIQDLDLHSALRVAREHHVVGFQVAMHNPHSMGRADALDDLQHDLECGAIPEPFTLREQRLVEPLKGLAVDEFHHHESQTVRCLIDVGDGDDVGAFDARRDLCLLEKALHEPRSFGQLPVKKLQRDAGSEELM